MIVSKDDIKTLLSITSTSQDDLINMMIPIVEDDIRQYCNNGFRNESVYLQSGDISFTHNSTSADTINLDIGTNEDGFTEYQFKAGQTVQVEGSYNNDGFYEVETVSSTALTLYTSTSRPYFNELVTEDEPVLYRVTQVKYPDALKLIVSQMVNYKISTHDYSVVSETVARYSVTFNVAGEMDSGYPKAVMKGLNRWRIPFFK